MIQKEYQPYYGELLTQSQKYVEKSRVRGSFQRVLSGESDPRFILDYRNYAFAKATRTLSAVLSVLEKGCYEEAIILSRSIFECYLSSRYFDENFDLELLQDMVVTPTAINQGQYVHKSGTVIDRKTGDTVEYNLRNPDAMSVGKDKSYYYDLYYRMCEVAHCNIAMVGPYLDDHGNFTLYSDENREAAHVLSLFVFSKLFESVVLIESNVFEKEPEEKACVDFFMDLTGFLFDKLNAFYDSQPDTDAGKDWRKLLRSMMTSLKEQLGRVDKSFVNELEKEYVDTSLERDLKPVLLTSGKPSEYFEDLRKRNRLNPRYSELARLIGVEQDPKWHPEGDVWTHTMQVLDRAAELRDRVSDPYAFMLLALCHDLGKPATTTKDENGRIHSYGHETAGTVPAMKLLNKITNKRKVKKYVLDMIPLHMKPNIYVHDRSSEKVTDRLFETAPEPVDLIWFSGADKNSPPEDTQFLMERYQGYLERKGQAKT